MPITLSVTHDTAGGVIAEVKELLGLNGLPPMQEQPKDDPQPQKTRTRKGKEAEAPKEADTAGESAVGGANSATDASASTASQTTSGTASASTETQSGGGATSEVPNIDDLRASLKKLGATDGFGADKVFEVLGKYGAKNASTVPEDKRAEVIKAIDDMLAGAK